jgi:hypothetical protein
MIYISQGHVHKKYVKDILTPECLKFISKLHNKFSSELSKKHKNILNFRDDTKNIRDLNWTVEMLPTI